MAWRANVLKVQQFFNLAYQGVKRRTNFSAVFKRIFQFLNFSIILNICKFQECLGNSRKFISWNKEIKFWHLLNFIKEKPYQPKTFDIVFNEAHEINRTIIRLAQSGAGSIIPELQSRVTKPSNALWRHQRVTNSKILFL